MKTDKAGNAAGVFTTNRLEALTDGVFAIVMTLLVLDISIPLITHSSLKGELFRQLIELWPTFLSYVMSFILLGIFWTGHRFAFHYVNRCDVRLIWINILFLMFISLIPFTTSFNAEYLVEQLPLALYLAHVVVILIMRLILWTYVTGKHRLVDSDINPRLVKREKLVTIGFAVLLLAGIGITFVNAAVVWHAMWVLVVFAFVTGGGQPR